MCNNAPTQANIVRWMKQNHRQYLERWTEELNITKLAEAAVHHFDGYVVNMETGERDFVPQEYFDCAFDVSIWYDEDDRDDE